MRRTKAQLMSNVTKSNGISPEAVIVAAALTIAAVVCVYVVYVAM